MVHATPDEEAAVRAFDADMRRAWQQLAQELGVRMEHIPHAQAILVAFGLAVWRVAKAHERTFGRGKGGRLPSGVTPVQSGWPADETTPLIGRPTTPNDPREETTRAERPRAKRRR